jgi:hypothetical protein
LEALAVSAFNPAPVLAGGPIHRESWFERNWKWFVPTILLSAFLVFALFVFACYSLAHSVIARSHPYRVAIERAERSSDVAAELGTPLHVGFFASGELNYFGPNAVASLTIPISGPRGKGRIIVEAKKSAGRWTFQTLEVDVKGKAEPIPLLNPGDDGAPSAPGVRI